MEIRNRMNYIYVACCLWLICGILLLTADSLVAEWIFKDDIRLRLDDLLPYIKSNEEINTNVRAHEEVIAWIAMNQGKFSENASTAWGRFWTRNGRRTCEVVASKLDEFLTSKGFNKTGYLSWAQASNKIFCGQGADAKRKAISVSFNGTTVQKLARTCRFVLLTKEPESIENTRVCDVMKGWAKLW